MPSADKLLLLQLPVSTRFSALVKADVKADNRLIIDRINGKIYYPFHPFYIRYVNLMVRYGIYISHLSKNHFFLSIYCFLVYLFYKINFFIIS